MAELKEEDILTTITPGPGPLPAALSESFDQEICQL